MKDKPRMYGRCFVLAYVIKSNGQMDADYASGILMHPDEQMLTDTILYDKWEHFTCVNEDDLMDEFYDMLESQGYTTCFMLEPIPVLDVT